MLPYEKVGLETSSTYDSIGMWLTSVQVALKDVVWLNKNEEVNVIARYAPWDGLYMVSRCFKQPSRSPDLGTQTNPRSFTATTSFTRTT